MSGYLKKTLILLVVLLLVACGGGAEGGDDDGDDDGNGDGVTATTQGSDSGSADTTVAPPPDDDDDDDDNNGGSGVGDPGNNQVVFEFGGNWEGSGTWEFLAISSSYVDGVWWLTFVPDADDATGATAGLTIQAMEDGAVGYLSEDFVTSATSDQCDIDVENTSADGTSGSFDCTDITGFPTDGSVMDGIEFRGSWRTGG
jgi:hypothetical protein